MVLIGEVLDIDGLKWMFGFGSIYGLEGNYVVTGLLVIIEF